MKKITVPSIRRSVKPITMLTAYDYWTSQLVDRAGVDMMLVGDSLGMVMLGHENTLSVTMDDMVYHAKAVVRGRERALVIGDMPYLSFHVSDQETIRNAGRLIVEAGVDAVKLEGGAVRLDRIKALIQAEIPVMGHLGLTPQSVNKMGGYRVQGKTKASRRKIMDDALLLQDAGVFSLVLECVPHEVAAEITDALRIPTIGIGAGPHCRGQVLVTHDMLGLLAGDAPKFVRRFADLGAAGEQAVRSFCDAVEGGTYPSLDESYGLKKKTKMIRGPYLKAENF